MSRSWFCLVAGAVLATATAAMAQDTPNWCQDHPLFPAPSGFKCADREEQKLGAEEFAIGGNGGPVVVEGRRVRIKYYLEESAPLADPAMILDHYEKIVGRHDAPQAWRVEEEGGRAAGFFVMAGEKAVYLKVIARADEVELIIVEKEGDGPPPGNAGR
jgi:hypothetical protein